MVRRTTEPPNHLVRWLGGSVVRWFGGSLEMKENEGNSKTLKNMKENERTGGSVARWFGEPPNHRATEPGGSVARWLGGSVVR